MALLSLSSTESVFRAWLGMIANTKLFGSGQIVTIRTNGQPGSGYVRLPPHRTLSRCDLPENNESISRIYRYNTENNNNRCKHAALVTGCDCRAGTTQSATNGSSRSLVPLSLSMN